MIQKYPYTKLGDAQHGWLHARYHFSFARYVDRSKMGFPPLRVWNDDIIQAQTGFPTHPHQNMEIITYVKEGAITHEDSMGNKGRTEAGQIQIMSAGSGITHSEYNLEDTETKLFQIWIEPSKMNIQPRWETLSLSDISTKESINLLASGREIHKGKTSIEIYQDAAIYVITVQKNESLQCPFENNRHGYGVVSKGTLSINNIEFSKGDGLYIFKEDKPTIQGQDDINELVFVDLPIL
jgi:quercetin 2,3-dioxygenase